MGRSGSFQTGEKVEGIVSGTCQSLGSVAVQVLTLTGTLLCVSVTFPDHLLFE